MSQDDEHVRSTWRTRAKGTWLAQLCLKLIVLGFNGITKHTPEGSVHRWPCTSYTGSLVSVAWSASVAHALHLLSFGEAHWAVRDTWLSAVTCRGHMVK